MKMIPVVNAIIIKNNKILLGKRKHDKKYLAVFWTTPGGKVEPDEKIRDALKREVKEETGLEVKIIKLLRVFEEFHDDHHHITFDFLVEPKSEKIKPDSDLVELLWFGKKELQKIKMTKKDKEFLKKIKFSGANETSIEI